MPRRRQQHQEGCLWFSPSPSKHCLLLPGLTHQSQRQSWQRSWLDHTESLALHRSHIGCYVMVQLSGLGSLDLKPTSMSPASQPSTLRGALYSLSVSGVRRDSSYQARLLATSPISLLRSRLRILLPTLQAVHSSKSHNLSLHNVWASMYVLPIAKISCIDLPPLASGTICPCLRRCSKYQANLVSNKQTAGHDS